MNLSIIDSLYKRNKDIIEYFQKNDELSLETDSTIFFRKYLILAAASYFEKRICDIIKLFVDKSSNSNLISEFVSNKAISRQYHTYFDWDRNNVNTFWGLFGQDFKNHCNNKIKLNEEYQKQMKAFLEIGRIRNELVHMNFASYNLEKTLSEYYDLYKLANDFILFFEMELNEYKSGV